MQMKAGASESTPSLENRAGSDSGAMHPKDCQPGIEVEDEVMTASPLQRVLSKQRWNPLSWNEQAVIPMRCIRGAARLDWTRSRRR